MSILHILETLAVAMNVVMGAIIAYFLSHLRWEQKENRASIVGFGVMLGLYILDVVLLLAP